MERPCHVVGMDIGGTNARAALVAWDGHGGTLVADRRVRIRGATSPEEIVGVVERLVVACCADGGVPVEEIQGVGIGFAGQLSRDGRVVLNSPNLFWRDVPFAAMLEAALSVRRVVLANDLNAIVWGECQQGAGRGFDDVLALYVGTGIGAGVVHRGRLLTGYGGNAGELGHAKVPGLTASCGCGQVGCVEALAGGRAIEERVARDVAAGLAAGMEAYLRPQTAPSAVEVELAAHAGVSYALALWDEVAAAIADVLSAALATLNPRALLLGGGVLEGCPVLRARLVARLSERVAEVIWRDVTVLTPHLPGDAGILGAAFLALPELGTPSG